MTPARAPPIRYQFISLAGAGAGAGAGVGAGVGAGGAGAGAGAGGAGAGALTSEGVVSARMVKAVKWFISLVVMVLSSGLTVESRKTHLPVASSNMAIARFFSSNPLGKSSGS